MSRHHAAQRAVQARLRRQALDRDGWRCTEPGCGSPVNLECHHDPPLDKGGTNTLAGVRMVCAACHIRIHRRDRDADRAAWRKLLWESIA